MYKKGNYPKYLNNVKIRNEIIIVYLHLVIGIYFINKLDIPLLIVYMIFKTPIQWSILVFIETILGNNNNNNMNNNKGKVIAYFFLML